MNKMQTGTMVEAFLKLQDIECAERVVYAINSYFSSGDSDYSFSEIRNGGTNSSELILVFIGPGQDHKEIADSVHRFLISFMDEFYDDTLEDDWLNEMDCDEMPSIISYEVNAAKAYTEESN